MRAKKVRVKRPRFRVQSYTVSKSAYAIRKFLGLKAVKNKNSNFVGRPTDIIVNWGNVKVKHNALYLNPLDAVITATNKISTFVALQAASVSTPKFHLHKSELCPMITYMARTTVSGHSGQGIVTGKPHEIPYAPLYSELVNKTAEYRAIVVDGEVVDFKQKLKKNGWEGTRDDEDVWNHGNGYIFARNGINRPEAAFTEAIKALDALGLKYAAVDLIEDAEGKVYVLELNTAFGVEGSTTELVGRALRDLIIKTRNNVRGV